MSNLINSQIPGYQCGDCGTMNELTHGDGCRVLAEFLHMAPRRKVDEYMQKQQEYERSKQVQQQGAHPAPVVDVDWDEVIERADGSPRAILAEAMAEIDGVDEIVVITRRHKPGSEQRQMALYTSLEDEVIALGLLRFAEKIVTSDAWGMDED